MEWIKEIFNTSKPIIAMCHLEALPGDPHYLESKGLDWIVNRARNDMLALQEGGVDAILFSNERSLPYLTKVEPITTICMARIITELKGELRVPFGVNVLWDPIASIDLAVAIGAQFVREVFTGVYASDYGLWNINIGQVVRHQYAVCGQNVRLFFNILPEASSYLGDRDIVDIVLSTVFNSRPDALCVSGLTAGVGTNHAVLKRVKEAVPTIPVFANTGVRLDTLDTILSIADGAITGTTFKRDGNIWNEVDLSRVREFMLRARAICSS